MKDRTLTDADLAELTRLAMEMTWRIDHGQADSVHELFVDDGEITIGSVVLKGRDATKGWGKRRVDATFHTFHVCSNMRFVADGDNAANGCTYITVYQREGDAIGEAVPTGVGEDDDRFVYTEQGWRFAARKFTLLG